MYHSVSRTVIITLSTSVDPAGCYTYCVSVLPPPGSQRKCDWPCTQRMQAHISCSHQMHAPSCPAPTPNASPKSPLMRALRKASLNDSSLFVASEAVTVGGMLTLTVTVAVTPLCRLKGREVFEAREVREASVKGKVGVGAYGGRRASQ